MLICYVDCEAVDLVDQNCYNNTQTKGKTNKQPRGNKMYIIESEVKKFASAKRSQHGHRSVYLDNVMGIDRLNHKIEQMLQSQKQVISAMGIDPDQKQPELRHGARNRVVLKTIRQAWADIEKKLDKFNRSNPNFVNWSMGEIKMLNGVNQIIDNQLALIGEPRDTWCRKTLLISRLYQNGQYHTVLPMPESDVEFDQDHPINDLIDRYTNKRKY